MPNYLNKVVYLTQEQYDTLIQNNTITVDDTTITYSDNDLYITPVEDKYLVLKDSALRYEINQMNSALTLSAPTTEHALDSNGISYRWDQEHGLLTITNPNVQSYFRLTGDTLGYNTNWSNLKGNTESAFLEAGHFYRLSLELVSGTATADTTTGKTISACIYHYNNSWNDNATPGNPYIYYHSGSGNSAKRNLFICTYGTFVNATYAIKLEDVSDVYRQESLIHKANGFVDLQSTPLDTIPSALSQQNITGLNWDGQTCLTLSRNTGDYHAWLKLSGTFAAATGSSDAMTAGADCTNFIAGHKYRVTVKPMLGTWTTSDDNDLGHVVIYSVDSLTNSDKKAEYSIGTPFYINWTADDGAGAVWCFIRKTATCSVTLYCFVEDVTDEIVQVLTPTTTTMILQPCPVTYNFGEVAELTVTVTTDTEYHFMYTCPTNTATVITINGITGTAGDTPEADKTYEVDVWAGIALTKEVEVTAV